LALVGMGLVFGACKKPTENREAPAAVPRGALELIFPYGSEKEKWITDVTKTFNQSSFKTQSGKPIFVRAPRWVRERALTIFYRVACKRI